MAVQNGTFRRVWSRRGGGQGEENSPAPGPLGPAGWRETELAIVQPVLAEEYVSKARGAGDFLSSQGGSFPCPQKRGERNVGGRNGCLRMPSFLEPGIAWGSSVLTDLLY